MISAEHLSGITAFVQAADAGGFTLAAERLGLSKSGIAKSVARLEDRLGVRLFNRTTRRFALTTEGQSFYETCVRVLADLENAEAALNAHRLRPRGRLRIDLPVVFGRRWVLPVLLDIGEHYPELSLEVSLTDRRIDPIDEGIDLVIRIGDLEDSSTLVARRLGVQQSVLCASPDYLDRHGSPNVEDRPADRSILLRERLVARAMNLRRWQYDLRPGDLSIDYHTGGIIAKLLMNSHDPFAGTRSYLVPAVFDRVDPLLNAIRPMMTGGPTPFIALCTMNTLLVAPRARHLDFLLSAAEAWLAKLPTDTSLWIELGIGRRIVEWFNTVAETDSTLHGRAHSQRNRMDALIGRLVGLGVAEAHEFEKRAEES